jgi:hypothetical protein
MRPATPTAHHSLPCTPQCIPLHELLAPSRVIPPPPSHIPLTLLPAFKPTHLSCLQVPANMRQVLVAAAGIYDHIQLRGRHLLEYSTYL